MADIDFNLFESIETALIGDTGMFFSRGMQIFGYITPLVTTGLGVYIILQAYHYYNKGFDESILDISRRMVGWIVIAMLALNANNYQKIAKLAYQLPDEIASVINGTELKGNVLDASRKNSDEMMESLHKKAEKPLDGLGKLGKYVLFAFNMTMSKIFAAILLLVIFVYYLITKIFLLMVLMVGPIFLSCLFFPTLRQWGMQWINQIGNYTITIVLYVVLANIQKNFFDSTLLGFMRSIDNNVAMGGSPAVLVSYSSMMFVMFALSTIAFILAAIKVPTLSSALTGGATIESGIRSLSHFANPILKNLGRSNSMTPK